VFGPLQPDTAKAPCLRAGRPVPFNRAFSRNAFLKIDLSGGDGGPLTMIILAWWRFCERFDLIIVERLSSLRTAVTGWL